MRFRILPITIGIAFLLLISQFVDFFSTHSVFKDIVMVADLNAKPKEEVKVDSPSTTPLKAEEKVKEEEHATGKPKEEPKAMEAPSSPTTPPQPTYSDAELNVLQSLRERHLALNLREKKIILEEHVLDATHEKLTLKLAELNELKEEVKELLKKYDEQEYTKIQSLVKIYETMKPKQAALIFERMEMPILLDVVSHMKEARASPILAQMDPQSAKELTTALATRKQLSSVQTIRDEQQSDTP